MIYLQTRRFKRSQPSFLAAVTQQTFPLMGGREGGGGSFTTLEKHGMLLGNETALKAMRKVILRLCEKQRRVARRHRSVWPSFRSRLVSFGGKTFQIFKILPTPHLYVPQPEQVRVHVKLDVNQQHQYEGSPSQLNKRLSGLCLYLQFPVSG